MNMSDTDLLAREELLPYLLDASKSCKQFLVQEHTPSRVVYTND
jgi:hypothetical protein